MIKAIFCDLDGTIIPDHNVDLISLNLKNKIKEMKNKGIKTYICTGRSYFSSKFVHELLELDTELISYNGSIITDCVTEKNIYECIIDLDNVKKIIEITDKYKSHLNLYIDGILSVRDDSEMVKLYSKFSGVNYKIISFDELKTGSTKCLIINYDKSILEKIKKEIEDNCKDLVCLYSSDIFLEILNNTAGKEKAVQFICDKYGYKLDEIMTFGDQWNDFNMLKMTPNGYLMGNANDDIKAHFDAKNITTACDDDGIYRIIKDL